MTGTQGMGYNPPMPDEPQAPPIWVNVPPMLRRMAAVLQKAPRIAVDTESNSLYAYHEHTCLIQFSIPGVDYLVDSLALTDLSTLAPLFADPTIEKVFHAGEYDLICLKRDYGFTFANLFDTMIAARVLGRKAVGLAAMLEEQFGLQLDKKYQRANWGLRPLPMEMLAYARLDSYYLLELRDRLEVELETAGRLGIAREDFQRLCATPVPPPENGESIWRVAGGKELTPRQAAVLSELCHYRDHVAQRRDLPRFKILSNDVLVELALTCPQTVDELAEVAGVTMRIIEQHRAGLLDAIARGQTTAEIHRPGRSRRDEQLMVRLDLLRNWRKTVGLEMEVESDVILPREELEAIAAADPHTLEDLQPLLAHLPDRFAAYGSQILAALHPEKKHED